jgi:hypothetical protein
MIRCIDRSIGVLLIILLAGSPELFAMAGQENGGPVAQTTPATAAQQSATQANSQEAEHQDSGSPDRDLPDSPGSLLAQQSAQGVPSQPPAQDSQPAQGSPPAQTDPAAKQATSPEPNTPPNGSQAPSNPQSQSAPQQPVGAAAAQIGRTTGGAASKPAGAALAPAKQNRTRSLVLKLGLLAGAGIAVGTVAALSHASPSRPPGTPAH